MAEATRTEPLTPAQIADLDQYKAAMRDPKSRLREALQERLKKPKKEGEEGREEGKVSLPESVLKEVTVSPITDKLEEILSRTKTTEGNIKDMKRNSTPPGERLSEKENWREYGWSTTDVLQLGETIEKFMEKEELTDAEEEDLRVVRSSGEFKKVYNSFNQKTRSLLDFLLATGKTSQQIRNEIENVLGNKDLLKSLQEDARKRQEPWEAYFLMSSFGIREDYLRRFVFYDRYEYGQFNERDYQSRPENIEELAWQMARSKELPKWGANGSLPLLEMQIVVKKDKQGNEMFDKRTGKKVIDDKQSSLYINEGNMVHWVRDVLMKEHDKSEHSVPQFNDIKVDKDFGDITIEKMFVDNEILFASEDEKRSYMALSLTMLLEAVNFIQLRTVELGIKQKGVRAKGKNLMEWYMNFFDTSQLTRKLVSKNTLFNIMNTPLDYESPRPGESRTSDGTVGAIWNHLNMAYWYLSDFEKLQEILGKDSSFFNREGFKNAIKKIWLKKQDYFSGQLLPEGFLPKDEADNFYKTFNEAFKSEEEGGGVKNKDKFRDLVNFFRERDPSQNRVSVVRQALSDAMAEIYGKQDPKQLEKAQAEGRTIPKKDREYHLYTKKGVEVDNVLDMAELMSYSWCDISGATLMNMLGQPAFFVEVKWNNTAKYRWKYFAGRGGNGNPANIWQFKELKVPLVQALKTTAMTNQTELVYVRDKHNNILFKRDKEGNLALGPDGKPVPLKKEQLVVRDGEVKQRPMVLFEVMEELHRVSMAGRTYLRKLEDKINAERNPDKKATLLKELEKEQEKVALVMQETTNKVEFRQDAENAYIVDHGERAMQFYEILSGAKEIEFSKFIHHTIFGPKFDRAGFQDAITNNFITVLRYGYQASGLNYGMLVRRPIGYQDPKKPGGLKEQFEYVPLGEAMFGYQVLNRKEFWKTDANGKWERDQNGRHVIDYSKLQNDEGRKVLFKQMLLVKLAGDLKAHIATHMSDPQFTFMEKMALIDGVRTIPGIQEGDEFSLGAKELGYFFTKEEFKMFKKMAGATTRQVLMQEVGGMFLPKADQDNKPGTAGTLLRQMFRLAA